MNIIKFIVCDDNPSERLLVKSILNEVLIDRKIKAEIIEYSDANDLLYNYDNKDVYAIFLDIYMKNSNGIEIAKKIKEIDKNAIIVFITHSVDYAVEAFEVEAYNYLIKPLKKEKMEKIIDKLYNKVVNQTFIEIKCGRATKEIPLYDLRYIETSGRYVMVHTKNDDFETSMTIKYLIDILPTDYFYRPIRFAIVSFASIIKITDNEIVLDKGEHINISKKEKEELRKAFLSYKFRNFQ